LNINYGTEMTILDVLQGEPQCILRGAKHDERAADSC
jgi:hypothetical protein